MHTPESDDLDWALLARYFAGEGTGADAAAVRRWAAAAPGRQEHVQQLAELWDRTGSLEQAFDTEAMLRRLRHLHQGTARPGRAHAPAPVPGRGSERSRTLRLVPSRPSTRWAGGARVAAVLSAVAATALVWLAGGRGPTPPAATAPESVTEVATRRGQRAILTLVDGTRVTLGVASRLRYAKSYGTSARDLSLEGEAYFEVVHDARRPFRVRTPRAVTEDLGTAFGVRAYQGDATVQVVVADGAVVLKPARVGAVPSAAGGPPGAGRPRGGGATDSLVLTRADLGRVGADGRLAKQTGVDPAAYLAWTRGELVFRDAPLGDVAAQLGRWYDVTVAVPDAALARRRLTATITGETAEEALRYAAATLGARVERAAGGGRTPARAFVLRPR